MPTSARAVSILAWRGLSRRLLAWLSQRTPGRDAGAKEGQAPLSVATPSWPALSAGVGVAPVYWGVQNP